MALLSSELASVHAMCCIRCGATIVLERPAEPAHRVCGAPGATAACQFVRLCSADRLDDASAQQLLYAIRGAKRRAHFGAQHATEVRARAAALVAETRALAQRCTVASDRQALRSKDAALDTDGSSGRCGADCARCALLRSRAANSNPLRRLEPRRARLGPEIIRSLFP